MARRRLRKNCSLEPNLYKDGTAYVYRNPLSGKRTRINRSLNDANALARKANVRLMKADDSATLNQMLSCESPIFSSVCDKFFCDVIMQSKNKETTRREKRYRLDKLKKDLEKQPVDTFTVKQLSDYLDNNFVNDAYIAHRGLLIDIFKYAKAKGFYEGENPAAQTLEKTRAPKSRKRHNWEGLQHIIQYSDPWLQRAIKLALYTLQRREDLVNLKKDQVEGEYLYLKQSKSDGAQFDKPIYLKIRMGAELKEIVQECLTSPIPSPYLLHYRPKRIRHSPSTSKPHWTYVTPDYLSKQFSMARRKANAYPDLKSNEQPTFHEIRALGSWIYEHRAGFSHDYVQMLMGHSTGKMTTEYQEGHEVKYQEVEAGLSLRNLTI